MKIGILQTGKVNEALVGRWGEYPEMVAAMLSAEAPEFTYATWAVLDGEMPDNPTACDAWIVPGSRHGVYDPLPWIAPLKAFLRASRQAGRPILGICFGHQIIAEAFGGRAEKVSKGWGTGRHEYDLQATPSWMAGADAPLALYCSHQDQVTALPSDATLIAGNDHCPHAVVAWGSDPDRPEAISVQAHPEYPRGYADGLFEVLRDKGSITAQQASDAVSSTAAGADGRRVAAWFVTYLRRHAAASAAA